MSERHVTFEVDGHPVAIVPEANREKYRRLEYLKGVCCRATDPEEIHAKPHLVVQKRRRRKRNGGGQIGLFE